MLRAPSIFDLIANLVTPRGILASFSFLKGLTKYPKRSATDVLTSTRLIGFRTSPLTAPLAVMLPIQSKVSLLAGDNVAYDNGTQISGFNYDCANSYQGTRIALYEPLFTGADSTQRMVWVGGSAYLLWKTTGNALTFHPTNVTSATLASQTHALLDRLMVVGRWDCDNPLSGSVYADVALNDGTPGTYTSAITAVTPLISPRIGQNGGAYGGHLIYALCDVDYPISTAERTALGTGTSPVSPDRVILHPEGIKFLFSPGAASLSGNLATGSNANMACFWNKRLYNSSTNPYGNLVVNGDFETALSTEWTVSASTVRSTTAADLAGLFDTACLKLITTAADATAFQDIAIAAGTKLYFSAFGKKGTTTNIRMQVWSGAAADPEAGTLLLDETDTSGSAVKFSGCGTIGVGHDTLRIKFTGTRSAAADEVAYVDNVDVHINLVTNGEMEGTYTDGLVASWTKTGNPTLTESSDERTGAKAQAIAATANNDGITQNVTVANSTWHMLGAWVKVTTGNARLQTTSGAAANGSDTSTGTGSYEFLSCAVRTNATTLVVQVVGTANLDDFLVDDVFCIPLSSIALTATPANNANSQESNGVNQDGADTLTIPATGNISQGTGTLAMRFTPRGWSGNDGRWHFLFDTTVVSNNEIRCYKTNTNLLTFNITDDAGDQKTVYGDISAPLITNGTACTVIVRWSNGTMSLRLNGTALTTAGGTGAGTMSSLPTPIHIASDNAGLYQLDATVHAILPFDRYFSNEECASLENYLKSIG